MGFGRKIPNRRLVEQAVPVLGVSTDRSGANREGEIFFDSCGEGEGRDSVDLGADQCSKRPGSWSSKGVDRRLYFSDEEDLQRNSARLQTDRFAEALGFCFTAKAKACARHNKRRRVEIRGRDDDDRRSGNRRLTRALFTED
ncbi:hypothetical protein U1Q18_020149 [Sarracenia purpurea var. burkii]